MFTPPPPAGGSVPSVYAVDTTAHPYPDVLLAVVPELPSHEWEIPPASYNEGVAELFLSIVTEIEDQTAYRPSTAGRFDGGKITLRALSSASTSNGPTELRRYWCTKRRTSSPTATNRAIPRS